MVRAPSVVGAASEDAGGVTSPLPVALVRWIAPDGRKEPSSRAAGDVISRLGSGPSTCRPCS